MNILGYMDRVKDKYPTKNIREIVEKAITDTISNGTFGMKVDDIVDLYNTVCSKKDLTETDSISWFDNVIYTKPSAIFHLQSNQFEYVKNCFTKDEFEKKLRNSKNFKLSNIYFTFDDEKNILSFNNPMHIPFINERLHKCLENAIIMDYDWVTFNSLNAKFSVYFNRNLVAQGIELQDSLIFQSYNLSSLLDYVLEFYRPQLDDFAIRGVLAYYFKHIFTKYKSASDIGQTLSYLQSNYINYFETRHIKYDKFLPSKVLFNDDSEELDFRAWNVTFYLRDRDSAFKELVKNSIERFKNATGIRY
ncbi:MAG: hypothetical protein EOM76_06650 [Sphingobacteriia bacterium]|nr:hypothetical protein [Sphingobacteriia bacterium]